jgi:hypothetical protein
VTPAPADRNRILHAFKSQVPIAAGQIVGVSFTRPAASSVLPVVPIAAGWEYGCLGGGCASAIPSDANPVTASQYKELRAAMNAQFEADVDGDGLGDETQDPCVGICAPPLIPPASTPPGATPPVTMPPATTPPKKKKCSKGKKRKRGKCVKRHQNTRGPGAR